MNRWPLRYRCSATLPIELSSQLRVDYFCELVIYPKKVKNTSEYMKVHVFELRRTLCRYDWSSKLCLQLEKLKLKPKKEINSWTGFEPLTSAIPMQCFIANWAIEPTESWPLCEFVIYPYWEGEEYKWTFESSYIWTAETDMKIWLIIAIMPTT